MTLTINTNMTSKLVRNNLNSATKSLNSSIEKMTTGFKVNHASDNAAGFSIATGWLTQLGSLDVAMENVSMGVDLLSTAEENYSLITSHLQRVRDLTEQAANGTYGSSSLSAIKSEIMARLDEIDRISANAEFNGISLMKSGVGDLKLQVGIKDNSDSKITLSSTLFDAADSATLLGVAKDVFATSATTTATAASQLSVIDSALSNIDNRSVSIGAAQNKLESALGSLTVQSNNLTSSLSTIRDADVSEVSSRYVQAQILQQASATLLATANQLPSVALSLL